MTVDLGNQYIIEGLPVFGDDDRQDVFYVLPEKPRFRIDPDTQKPVFKMIKYKLDASRADGKKGGGFVVFDCEFVVAKDKMAKIQAALDTKVQEKGIKNAQGQPASAQIEHITYTDATASLTLLDSSGVLVGKIDSPGKPSLFGSMICPFTAELTPEGATVLEACLKGSGGVAQVSYDLHFPATFPPVSGSVWFNSQKFYSFYQSVDKSGSTWLSGNNTEVDRMHEAFTSSSAGGVSFNFDSLGYITDADLRKKIQDGITNWGWGQIETAVKTSVLPDIKAAEDRGDHGMDHIQKLQTTWESASFYRTLTERMGVSFGTTQGGTMPNIADMGFKFEDFVVEVDANDPFFATVNASVAVNVDFARYGITSVDVHCEYNKINPAEIKDFHMTKPDDIGKFVSNTNNGDMHYAYSFSVNYRDANQAYQSPLVETDKGQVTISANNLGVLFVEIAMGNIDFTKTPQVQVTIKYPDVDATGQPINQQFTFDKDKKTDQMLVVLLKDIDQIAQYQTTYIMADGTQMVTDWADVPMPRLTINSPFTTATYSFLSEGDFAAGIENIFLKMIYTDEAHSLEQETDFLFTAQNRQKDWAIPVVAHSKGKITYSGVVSYKNHTTENMPEVTTTSSLIEFGPPNQVVISVLPDPALIDFTKVKLIQVNFQYTDPANHLDVKQQVTLRPNVAPQPWTFYARDPNRTSYTWSATYYVGTTPPQVIRTQPVEASDADLVLMLPN